MTQFNTIQDDKPKTTTRDRKVLQDTRIDNFDDLVIEEDEVVAGRPPASKPSGKNQTNNVGNEYRTPEIEKPRSKNKSGKSPQGGPTSAQLSQQAKDYVKSIKTPEETKNFLEKAQSVLSSDKHTPKYFVDALPIVVNI